ncbi:glycosyltransferase [Bacteroidota bacterium]
MTYLIYGFNRNKQSVTFNSTKTDFSIIIAFRNESENLSALLTSLDALNYPKNKFEILLVNDFSTDNSVQIIEEFKQQHNSLNLQIFHAPKTTKKNAISYGILHSKFDQILGTDADCIVPTNWLTSYDAFLQTYPAKLIAGPVAYIYDTPFIAQFQNLEFTSLMGATMGGFGSGKPFMANGANISYSKSVFNEVNGFVGNENIASGDDVFLLEKIAKLYKDNIYFLKDDDAIVQTKPAANLKKLTAQRIRWAAKMTSSKNYFSKLVGAIVFFMNITLVATLFLNIQFTLLLFLTKIIVDFLLIKKTSLFLNQHSWKNHFIASLLLYPIFNVFIAIQSLYKGYTWKDRSFKK